MDIVAYREIMQYTLIRVRAGCSASDGEHRRHGAGII